MYSFFFQSCGATDSGSPRRRLVCAEAAVVVPGWQTLLSNYSRRRRRRIAPNTAQPSCRRSPLFNLNYAAFIRAPTRGCQHWSPELVGLQSIKQSSASPEQQQQEDDDKEELLFFSTWISYVILIIKLVHLLMEGRFLGLPKLLPRSRLDGLNEKTSVTLLESCQSHAVGEER